MRSLVILFSVICSTFCDNVAVQEFTNANNLFTHDIYKEIAKTEKNNFLVSPFSAETALAFLLSGAKGKTSEELSSALHLSNVTDSVNVESALKSILPKFKDNNLYSLYTANKIYIQKNFTLKPEFKEAASLVYQADSETVDFEKNVEATNTVNKWVEKHTNDKIQNLVDSKDLDNFTRVILVNALYFKANWSKPFLLSETRPQKFFKNEKEVVEVDMLNHYEEEFNYYECPHLNAQFLELPFQGNEATMVIVLPKEKNGLSNLENRLDSVFSVQHQFNQTLLNVVLPKFRIETMIDFKKILINLGVITVFEEKIADLSNIAGKPGDLFAKKIVQKTFIDVAEEGVEAAAATLVLVAYPESITYPRPIDFVADHPFIFYIKVKDIIIFAGRVTDPLPS